MCTKRVRVGSVIRASRECSGVPLRIELQSRRGSIMNNNVNMRNRLLNLTNSPGNEPPALKTEFSGPYLYRVADAFTAVQFDAATPREEFAEGRLHEASKIISQDSSKTFNNAEMDQIDRGVAAQLETAFTISVYQRNEMKMAVNLPNPLKRDGSLRYDTFTQLVSYLSQVPQLWSAVYKGVMSQKEKAMENPRLYTYVYEPIVEAALVDLNIRVNETLRGDIQK